MLSGLARSAGIVLTAKTNVRLKHIEFVRLEPERALAVLVAEDGQVENRVLNVPAGVPTSALVEAGDFPRCRIAASRWPNCATRSRSRPRKARPSSIKLTQKIIAAGLAELVGRRHRGPAS